MANEPPHWVLCFSISLRTYHHCRRWYSAMLSSLRTQLKHGFSIIGALNSPVALYRLYSIQIRQKTISALYSARIRCRWFSLELKITFTTVIWRRSLVLVIFILLSISKANFQHECNIVYHGGLGHITSSHLIITERYLLYEYFSGNILDNQKKNYIFLSLHSIS